MSDYKIDSEGNVEVTQYRTEDYRRLIKERLDAGESLKDLMREAFREKPSRFRVYAHTSLSSYRWSSFPSIPRTLLDPDRRKALFPDVFDLNKTFPVPNHFVTNALIEEVKKYDMMKFTIGEPKASDIYSRDVLRTMGYVGIYKNLRKKPEVSDD